MTLNNKGSQYFNKSQANISNECCKVKGNYILFTKYEKLLLLYFSLLTAYIDIEHAFSFKFYSRCLSIKRDRISVASFALGIKNLSISEGSALSGKPY